MNFKIDKSDILYKGVVFNLRVDEITYTNSGNKGLRQVAEHPGGAVVFPVTDDKKIVLVKQYRYAVDEWLLEGAAGKLEPGEDPAHCAERELKEETGYTASKIEKLGEVFSSPGFCDEKLYLYVATGLTKGEHAREEGEEGMEVFEYTMSELDELIRNDVITDAKTIAGFNLLKIKFSGLFE